MMDATTPAKTYPIGKHPQLPPPASERGIIHFVRKRLLNNWYNAVGTVLILYIAYLGVPPLLDWVFFDAVWEAKNNKDCWAQGDGACWGFISKRFLFFMYGFYDREVYWRPNTVGAMLVLSGAVIVFPRTPDTWKRYMVAFLIFIFPWIAVGLLVGPVRFTSWETIGGQVVTALAFAGGAYVGWRGHRANDGMKRLFGLSIIYIILVMVFLTWGLGLEEKESRSFGGLLLTLVLAITSISAGPLSPSRLVSAAKKLPAHRPVCGGLARKCRRARASKARCRAWVFAFWSRSRWCPCGCRRSTVPRRATSSTSSTAIRCGSRASTGTWSSVRCRVNACWRI